MSARVYSFDVYDTAITRPYLAPTDLFFAVARRLAADSAERYVAARIRAEQAARRRHAPREDVRFEDIYAEFGELAAWGVDSGEAMAAELAAEREACTAIGETAARVATLTGRGARVIFVSDMYLPGDFVWELLCELGMRVPRDAVYVSSDIGLAKYTGGLFAHVLEHEHIAAHELEHLGDNRRSDVRVPRRLGIRARRFTGIRPTRYERRLALVAAAHPRQGSAIGGVSRAVRLAGSGENATVARLAANVIAPFLTAFVAWVLEDARARGLDTLYFVSRDGQVFQRIAAVLSAASAGPACRYLYGSRQAWFLPAVTRVEPHTIDWAWARGMSSAPRDILRRLELDDEESHAVLAAHGYDAARMQQQLEGSGLADFGQRLCGTPWRERILARAAAARQRTSAYLRQEGLTAAQRWSLVDVGWTLKCQRALGDMLRAAGGEQAVHGYYLGIHNEHVPLELSGPCSVFVTQTGSDLGGAMVADWFFKLTVMILVEHLFTLADHPTVHGYRVGEQAVEPVFKQERPDADSDAFGREMQSAILDYVRALVRHPVVDPASAVFRQQALSAVHDFAMRPERADVAGIAWLPTNKDQSHDPRHRARLASPLGPADLWALVRHEFVSGHQAFFAPHFAWFAGSAALSAAPVRWLYRTLFHLRRLKPRHRQV